MRLVHTTILGIASGVLFWAWLFVLFLIMGQDVSVMWTSYRLYTVVVFVAFAVDFFISRMQETDLLNLELNTVLNLALRQTATVFGAILLFLVATKDAAISRAFLFTYIPVLYATLVFSNRILPAVLARFLFRHKRVERTLVVGDGEDVDRVLGWCRQKAHYGLNVVGRVSRPGTGPLGCSVPVLGAVGDLETIVRAHRITNVIVATLPACLARFSRLANLCDRLGVRLLAVNDLSKHFHRPISFFREGGLQFLTIRPEPLECPLNRLMKRALDVAFALPVVVLILPLLSLFVWILHRCQSPGPLFFRQVRSGIGSGKFTIYKFRTMHNNHGMEGRQATENDLRVFKAGSWLRKLSIDEIPQFINVLRGEMSIVGPRPHMLEHDHIFANVAAGYSVRAFVKPGITGLAQVRGYRGEATTASLVVSRVESDVYYLENWSLQLEWAIIFRTMWQMISPPRTAC